MCRARILGNNNADQPAWGRRIYELGAGSKPIPKKKLTAEKLASAILYALDPGVVSKADKLGKKLRKENGVGTAVKIINDYVQSRKAFDSVGNHYS